MSIVRCFYRPDGTVSIVRPGKNSKKANETDSQHWDRVMSETLVKNPDLQGLEFDDIDDVTLPPTRSRRDAWRGTKGNGVFVDGGFETKGEKRRRLLDEIDSESKKPVPNVKRALEVLKELLDR